MLLKDLVIGQRRKIKDIVNLKDVEEQKSRTKKFADEAVLKVINMNDFTGPF